MAPPLDDDQIATPFALWMNLAVILFSSLAAFAAAIVFVFWYYGETSPYPWPPSPGDAEFLILLKASPYLGALIGVGLCIWIRLDQRRIRLESLPPRRDSN